MAFGTESEHSMAFDTPLYSQEDSRVTTSHKGVVVWITGLPASGKTTVSRYAAKEIKRRYPTTSVEHLDDNTYASIFDGDGVELFVADIATRLALHGVVVLCSFTSPDRDLRLQAREIVENSGINFAEVFLSATIESCKERDTEGRYYSEEISGMGEVPGLSVPYDIPFHCELTINTDTQRASSCARMLVDYLFSMGFVYVPKYTYAEINSRVETVAVNEETVSETVQGTDELRITVTRMAGALETIYETVQQLDVDEMSKYMILRVAALALQIDPPMRPDGNPPIASAVFPSRGEYDELMEVLSEADFVDDIILSDGNEYIGDIED